MTTTRTTTSHDETPTFDAMLDRLADVAPAGSPLGRLLAEVASEVEQTDMNRGDAPLTFEDLAADVHRRLNLILGYGEDAGF